MKNMQWHILLVKKVEYIEWRICNDTFYRLRKWNTLNEEYAMTHSIG